MGDRPARAHESTPQLTIEVNGVGYTTTERTLDGVLGGQRIRAEWDGKEDLSIRVETREVAMPPTIIFGEDLVVFHVGLGRDGDSLLTEAASLFRTYEGLHRANVADWGGRGETAKAEISLGKAERNAEIAERIETWLAGRGKQDEGGTPAASFFDLQGRTVLTVNSPSGVPDTIEINGALFTPAAEALDQQKRVEGLALSLVQDLGDLIDRSEGVYGLHDNGDPAPWGELLRGGRFEDWLSSFDRLRDVLDAEGRCRICGCTEDSSCEVENEDGEDGTRRCRWYDDGTRTLCNAPACLDAAESNETGCLDPERHQGACGYARRASETAAVPFTRSPPFEGGECAKDVVPTGDEGE